MKFVKKNMPLVNVLLFILITLPLVSFTPTAKDKFKIKTVFIDPGHGGKDPGCHGVFSNEADVALKLSLQFGDLIKAKYPDIKVIYARTSDQFVDLYERAVMANKANADLFICIHCNASVNHSAYGTETYSMGLHRTDDNLAVAQRENAVILMENNYQDKYSGFDPNDPASYIMFSMMQNANLDQSVSLAAKVQDEFENIGRFNRGVHQAGFAVLVHTSMPSILIETGFLTNPNEERYLNSDEGSFNISNSIFRAFEKYKNEYEGKSGGVSKTIVIKKDDEQNNALPIANELPNVYYRIQFLSSPEAVSQDDEKLKLVNGYVIETTNEGKFKYMSALVKTADEALTKQNEFRKNGFKDAFIVTYQYGKRQATSNLHDK